MRSEGEHALVALPGSVLIPLPELAERLDELDRDGRSSPTATTESGRRARRRCSLGGFDAVSLRGGIDAWSVRVDPRVTLDTGGEEIGDLAVLVRQD